jgi:hypothetical protein
MPYFQISIVKKYKMSAGKPDQAFLTEPQQFLLIYSHEIDSKRKHRFFYVRFEVFSAVTMKNVLFCDIKTQFLLHRKHITTRLLSPVG